MTMPILTARVTLYLTDAPGQPWAPNRTMTKSLGWDDATVDIDLPADFLNHLTPENVDRTFASAVLSIATGDNQPADPIERAPAVGDVIVVRRTDDPGPGTAMAWDPDWLRLLAPDDWPPSGPVLLTSPKGARHKRCEGSGQLGANSKPQAEVTYDRVAREDLEANVDLRVACANCGSDYKVGHVAVQASIEVVAEDEHLYMCPDDREYDLIETTVEVREYDRPTERPQPPQNGTVLQPPAPLHYPIHCYRIIVVFIVQCSNCDTQFGIQGKAELADDELEAA